MNNALYNAISLMQTTTIGALGEELKKADAKFATQGKELEEVKTRLHAKLSLEFDLRTKIDQLERSYLKMKADVDTQLADKEKQIAALTIKRDQAERDIWQFAIRVNELTAERDAANAKKPGIPLAPRDVVMIDSEVLNKLAAPAMGFQVTLVNDLGLRKEYFRHLEDAQKRAFQHENEGPFHTAKTKIALLPVGHS